MRALLCVFAVVVLSACSRGSPAPVAGELITVVVASEDLNSGEELTIDNIARRDVDGVFVTTNTVLASSASEVVSKRLLISLKKGDALLWTAIEPGQAAESLSVKVTPNGRVKWIEVQDAARPGSYLRVGDHVDVLGTFRDPTTNENVSVTVVENLKIIAPSAHGAGARPNAVAVLVTPEQSQKLHLATELGSVALSLRAQGDESVGDGGRATIEDLIGGKGAAKK